MQPIAGAGPSAAPEAPPPIRDPVCGMDVDGDHPPGGVVQRGRYVYPFCSESCRRRFAAAPLDFIAFDPVCGMEVNPKAPKGGQLEHGGRRFYFCNPKCLAKFSSDPGAYLAHGPGGVPRDAAPPAAPPGAEVVWVCPMDPEVREKEPVPCPICGMALEPLVVGGMPSAEEPPNPELAHMTRRFWLGLAPAVAVLALAMGDMLLGSPLRHALGFRRFALVQLALASPVVLWGGFPFFERAWLSIRTWKLNMFTLIGLGTAAAYVFSAAATVLPAGAFPAAFLEHGSPPVYFEAAAVIVELVLLGQVLELTARRRVSGAIRALLALAPRTPSSQRSRCSSSPARARLGSRRRWRSWWAPAAGRPRACSSRTPRRSSGSRRWMCSSWTRPAPSPAGSRRSRRWWRSRRARKARSSGSRRASRKARSTRSPPRSSRRPHAAGSPSRRPRRSAPFRGRA